MKKIMFLMILSVLILSCSESDTREVQTESPVSGGCGVAQDNVVHNDYDIEQERGNF